MKRSLCIIFLLAACMSAAAQKCCKVVAGDTINCIDSQGRKQGWWKNPDSRKKYVLDEGMYVDGRKEGVWFDYYPNGKVRFTLTYKSGFPSGKVTAYYATGQKSEEGYWEHGVWTGEYTVYYVNGCVLSKTTYDKEGFKVKATYYAKDACGVVSKHPKRVKRSYRRILPARMDYEMNPPAPAYADMNLKAEYEERKKKAKAVETKQGKTSDIKKSEPSSEN